MELITQITWGQGVIPYHKAEDKWLINNTVLYTL